MSDAAPILQLAKECPKLAAQLAQVGARFAELSNSTSVHLSATLADQHQQLLAFLADHPDNPVVKQLVAAANHPLVVDYTNKGLNFASTYQSYLFGFFALCAQLYWVNASNKRQARQRNSQRLQDRAYRVAEIKAAKMVDLGLGNGLGGVSKGKQGFGEVEVQWGKEKIRVPLPPPNSPLSSFKDTLYNITGVPPSHMKLIYSGGLLKDDLAPLSSYDLVDADPTAGDSSAPTSFWDSWSFRSTSTRKLKKLVLLGSKNTSAVVNDHLSSRRDLLLPGSEEVVPPKPVEDESSVISKINSISTLKLDELRPMIKGVEEYLADLQGEKGADEPAPAPNPRALIFVSEALLQALLKLDSIDIQSGFTEARAARKQGVKVLQAELDKVDGLKEEWKKASKKGETEEKL